MFMAFFVFNMLQTLKHVQGDERRKNRHPEFISSRTRLGVSQSLASLLVFVLMGCAPSVDVQGYNPDDLDISKIEVGKDTQETVQEKMGSPSFIGQFPSSTSLSTSNKGTAWYYVSKTTSTTSFHHPDTMDQRCLHVVFNDEGLVIDKKLIIGETVIQPTKTTTPVKGHEGSIMKDIFGNFGRYATQKAKNPS
jgi:outer membrane protein assembly factor BamE (lipoprotein component of BamABCDE complex)